MLSEPVSSGKVVKVEGDTVEIAVPRSERCKSCGICPLSADGSVLLKVNVDRDVKVGDEVKIRTKDKYVILSAFIIYIIPVIALITGYFLGGLLFSSELLKIVSGFLFMGTSFLIDRFLDKKVRFPQEIELIV